MNINIRFQSVTIRFSYSINTLIKNIYKLLPSQDNRYCGWGSFNDALAYQEGYGSRLEYETWRDFHNVYKEADIDMNFVIDFYFTEEEYDGLISMNIWMAQA